jgi:Ca2+:H+ antiporter
MLTLPIFRVLSVALPAVFFAALDRGATANLGSAGSGTSNLFTDEMRGYFLKFSRGIAIILLIM